MNAGCGSTKTQHHQSLGEDKNAIKQPTRCAGDLGLDRDAAGGMVGRHQEFGILGDLDVGAVDEDRAVPGLSSRTHTHTGKTPGQRNRINAGEWNT